ncbi:hypothetical protein CIHG_09817 [Coccidioides immitis H538.4]|uniref:Uncharacterized protein n=3 Tax=Coccidioides immitis TaxID=5501 RepID=A0A0J8R8S0_COCIT|nr:hypothetical protein CIRG_09054 [Coccidioides immitis RMSCC 2394]KMU81291.1 hypothetical protein CISG_02668 [Coccidioides immitis RMSCC 3703]KMU91972.1 hypothetical protein CIHG_09817 [Coccidioides immitis H538.4]
MAPHSGRGEVEGSDSDDINISQSGIARVLFMVSPRSGNPCLSMSTVQSPPYICSEKAGVVLQGRKLGVQQNASSYKRKYTLSHLQISLTCLGNGKRRRSPAAHTRMIGRRGSLEYRNRSPCHDDLGSADECLEREHCAPRLFHIISTTPHATFAEFKLLRR